MIDTVCSMSYFSEEDGAWTGKMGQVSRNEVDILVSDCLISYTRSQVVQGSTFYDKDFLTWASPKPAPEAKYLSFIAPFQPLIWFLTALSVLSLSTVFWIVANCESKFNYINLKEWSALKASLWYSFGTLVGEGITSDSRSDGAPAMRLELFQKLKISHQSTFHPM